MSELKGTYQRKVIIIYLITFFDIYMNSFIESIDRDEDGAASAAIFSTIGQCVLRLANAFSILILVWDTFVFRQGLLGVLFSKFKLYIVVWPIAFSVCTVVRMIRLMMVIEEMDAFDIWDQAGYVPMYFIHNIGMFIRNKIKKQITSLYHIISPPA